MVERGLRVPGKVLGPGGKAGGVRRRPSAFSWRKETVGAAPHLRGSSDYLAGPSGSQGRGQGVGTGGWTERGGAGRRAPAFPLRSSQVTVPAGSCPAPPRRIFRRPACRVREQPALAAPGASARLCARGPARPSSRELAARHGCCGRPPQPPYSPPGARARPGADRKSRGRSHARAQGWGLGLRIQESGETLRLPRLAILRRRFRQSPR